MISVITLPWYPPSQVDGHLMVNIRIRFVDTIASYSQFANALNLNYRTNRHVCEDLWPF
jgi:hypothetical protein